MQALAAVELRSALHQILDWLRSPSFDAEDLAEIDVAIAARRREHEHAVREAEAQLASGATLGRRWVQAGSSGAGSASPQVAYQPHLGNWVQHEDAETTFQTAHNNDLWDRLPDGQDDDLLSDGCVRVATLNDLTSEWTGGIFDASGKHF